MTYTNLLSYSSKELLVQIYFAGDFRVNENIGLLSYQTAFVRYHNYVADNLRLRHRNWSDEKIFQVSNYFLHFLSHLPDDVIVITFSFF